MFHCKHSILLVNLIGHLIALASCNCQLKSMRILSQKDLLGTVEHLSLPGQSLSLVAEDGDRLYLGGRDAVYELRTSNISDFAKVAAWPSGGSGGLVRSLFFPGHSGSGAAFVCAIVGDGDSRVCRRFNRGSASAGRVWRHSAAAPVNRQISALLLPPAPSKKSQPPPVSLRLSRGNSRVFFAALPPIREATDLVELTGPEFADIGFTTADLYSRRSRALWMARGARAHVMHEVGDRMYAVYTEPAAETSNYVETVNTERSGLVQIPTFTRLARICLNDPGQTLGNRTSPRVLTSFFKLRLVCRHDGVDYDVLELATPVSDGQFIGLFAPQNSPTGGFRAVCRFRLADAERLLTGDGDFIELSRRSWQSPLLASRLSRENFRRRSDVSEPFNCSWTPEDAQRNRLSDLLVARMASLLALPMLAEALTVLPPQAAIDRRPTALTLLTEAEKLGVETDQLLVGWDTGEVTRLSASANVTLPPAVETLQVLPPGQPVESLLLRHRRILAVSPDGVSALPLTRCEDGNGGCAACGRLADPLCIWSTSADGTGRCTDRASLRARLTPGEMAAAATETAACAAKNRNSSHPCSRGLPLRPPKEPQGPRQLASTGGSSSGGGGGGGGGGVSQQSDGAPLSDASIGTGAFFGALAGASLLAFVVGVAIGVGCIADAARCRRGKPEPRQPISSTSTSSTSSSASKPRTSSTTTRNFLLKGIVASKAPRQPSETLVANSKAADPLMQQRRQQRRQHPEAPAEQRNERLCLDNEYVQTADLVPIATQGDAASLCSSWESCHSARGGGGGSGPTETVVELNSPELPQPPHQPHHYHQQQQPLQPQPPPAHVTVNAGIIGNLSLRVGFNGQSS
ncbi:hypothetical protein BOX15_Mlig005664g1 [Macrostomum lignano]|uniref:Sema domain-containing protein n=1 Tax=Macrostomum lignano TaxID=282301 RepID=A0A267EGQ3_9PLAT|nr:hypothetical protein BOX15_Mlig005664g1 [Macrostomum lignano]